MELNVIINEKQVDKVYSGELSLGQKTIMYTLTYPHGITPLDDKGNFIQDLPEDDYSTLMLKNRNGQQILVPKEISDSIKGHLGLAILPIHEYRKGELEWRGIPKPVADAIKSGIPLPTLTSIPIIEVHEHLYHKLEDIIRLDDTVSNQ